MMRSIVFTLLAVMAVQARVAVKPESSNLSEWELDGNGHWRAANGLLALDTAGVPGGAIRRPAALAILRSADLTDVSVRAQLRSTAPVDLLVRDVLLIFGYQSPARFYYVHLAAKTDAVHNGIFVVNDADRRRIDKAESRPALLDQAWHSVRLERRASTGSIEIYIDGDTKPILAATDETLWRRVGFGSFDETAEFRGIEISGSRR